MAHHRLMITTIPMSYVVHLVLHTHIGTEAHTQSLQRIGMYAAHSCPLPACTARHATVCLLRTWHKHIPTSKVWLIPPRTTALIPSRLCMSVALIEVLAYDSPHNA